MFAIIALSSHYHRTIIALSSHYHRTIIARANTNKLRVYLA